MQIAPALRLGHATPACALARAPHAALLASGDHVGRVLSWDLDTDELPRVIRGPAPPPSRRWLPGRLGTSADAVDELAFLAGGAQLAVALPGRVVVHDVATGALVATFRGCESPIAADGAGLWAYRKQAMVHLDPRTGGRTRRVPLRGCPRHPWYHPELDLTHRRAGLVHPDELLVWDLDTGRLTHRVPLPEAARGGIDFDPDGRRVTVVPFEVDLERGEVRHVPAAPAPEPTPERVRGDQAAVVDVSFDGPFVHSAHADGVVRTWHVRRRALVACHRSPWGLPKALDADRVVSAGACAWIWSVRTGEVLHRVELAVPDPPGAALAGDTLVVRSSRPRKRPAWIVDLATGARHALADAHAVGLTADGRIAAVSDPWRLDLLDVATGRRERLSEQEPRTEPWGLAFSPDGRRLAASSLGAWFDVWDLDAPRGAQRHVLDGPIVALADDGRIAGVSAYDPYPVLFDGHRWRALPPHGGPGRAVAIGPGGFVATGAADGSVHVHGRSGRLLVAFQVLPPGDGWLCRDGRRVLGGSPGHGRFVT